MCPDEQGLDSASMGSDIADADEPRARGASEMWLRKGWSDYAERIGGQSVMGYIWRSKYTARVTFSANLQTASYRHTHAPDAICSTVWTTHTLLFLSVCVCQSVHLRTYSEYMQFPHFTAHVCVCSQRYIFCSARNRNNGASSLRCSVCGCVFAGGICGLRVGGGQRVRGSLGVWPCGTHCICRIWGVCGFAVSGCAIQGWRQEGSPQRHAVLS